MGLRGDWLKNISIDAEDDLDELMHSVDPLTVNDDYPHSVSSGVLVTGSSCPTTQPNSHDESVGGITDDAEEREGYGDLSGNAMLAETLKSYYGGRSKASETRVSNTEYWHKL